MGALRRNVQKLVYALIAAALVATAAATTVAGFRLHHSAVVERQTIRTRELETDVLERRRSAVEAVFRSIEKRDASEATRLRAAYVAYLRRSSAGPAFERAIEAELGTQSAEIRRINPAARSALIAAVACATVLVLALGWLFELERRAGRIDRDNAARAEELVRLRDEFVAVVSHELRTPLTSIVGYLELLGEEPLTDEQRTYVEIVQRSTARLADLVGDLLLVAEAGRGPLALELTEVDTAALAADAIEAARPAAEAQDVSLLLGHSSPALVAGDPTRLAQMLDNLVSNAIKFTLAGGSVTVSAGRRGTNAVFEVSDTGCGVTVADRERLFEPFFRSSEANARAIPGTGLGLAITKAIVDAHHGTIEVEGTPGGGTTFRVWLPLAESLEPVSPR